MRYRYPWLIRNWITVSRSDVFQSRKLCNILLLFKRHSWWKPKRNTIAIYSRWWDHRFLHLIYRGSSEYPVLLLLWKNCNLRPESDYKHSISNSVGSYRLNQNQAPDPDICHPVRFEDDFARWFSEEISIATWYNFTVAGTKCNSSTQYPRQFSVFPRYDTSSISWNRYHLFCMISYVNSAPYQRMSSWNES